MVLVIARVVAAVGPNGNLEVGLFLVAIIILYAAWHTASSIRTGAMTALATATPWFLVSVLDADLGWLPWSTANVFPSPRW